MTILRRFGASLVFALCLVTVSMSQALAEKVTLNFSDADLVAVINSVSQITGRNFIIDPRVRGKVTVVSSTPLDEEEVYNVFLSILQVYGFAALPGDGAIKIVPDAVAKQNSSAVVSGATGSSDRLITKVIKVSNINAAQLVPILRPLVAQQGHLAAYAQTNMLVITDRAGNIRKIDRIIEQMDRQVDSEIEVIKLQHAFAAEVVRLLRSLNLGAPDPKNPAAGIVNFTADERTNSVLISGEVSDRLKYRAIIADLDAPVASTGNTHVVYLRYAEATNIATLLTNVGRDAARAEAKSASGGDAANDPGIVNVQADEAANALVITAPASVYPSLRSVIQQLDIPRAQVHIEAIIAEVSLDTANELGVQWLINSPDGDGAALSTQFSSSGSSISSVAAGNIPDGATLGLGQLDDPNINFITLIRALAGDSQTNLLSTPSIVTLDNQEAEIVVGQNVPFVTGETTSSSNSVVNPFRTVQREDIGISLKVRPQINEGDAITMDIQQEASSIAGSATGAVDIITNKRSIKTSVQLEDGEMLVLGGLIDEKTIESEQKVPGLGDIPVLGALFRSTRSTRVKQNLLVFIRSTIIKDPVKAKRLSERKYNLMRNLQLENIEDGEPMGPILDPL